MRLVDADVADKWMQQNNAFIDSAILKAIPTIDAVPVVRCMECDNHSEVDGQHYCKFWRMYCPDDSEFFCKAGQRKEADHDKHPSDPV